MILKVLGMPKTTKNFKAGNTMTNDEWIKYFEALINPDFRAVAFCYAPPRILVPVIDDQFTFRELSCVLNRASEGKVPSLDRVPTFFIQSLIL